MNIDIFTAEQLLRGELSDGAASPAMSPLLPELLAAAAKAAVDPVDELDGEGLAVAGFVRVQRSRRVTRQPSDAHPSKAVLAIIVGAVVATAAMGVGAAAVIFDGGGPATPAPSTSVSTTPSSRAPSSSPSKRPATLPPHRPSRPTPAKKRPAVSLAAVCRSYLEGKALTRGESARLHDAAGGGAAVERYCDRLVGPTPDRPSTARSYPTTYPTSYPTTYATSYPTSFNPTRWPTYSYPTAPTWSDSFGWR